MPDSCVARHGRLQMRMRAIAAVAALWLVLCGVLAARHEATVGHTRDAVGNEVHTAALAGEHRDLNADIHGVLRPDDDTATCTLLNAFHQSASAACAAPAIASCGSAIPTRAVMIRSPARPPTPGPTQRSEC
jgi:hypothetical protein